MVLPTRLQFWKLFVVFGFAYCFAILKKEEAMRITCCFLVGLKWFDRCSQQSRHTFLIIFVIRSYADDSDVLEVDEENT